MRYHEQLIEQACSQHGWQRGDRGWRAAFFAACEGDEFWRAGAALDNLRDYFAHVDARPDAWRVTAEDDILVLEFLEVEVTHGVGARKRKVYRNMWYFFDATEVFGFRVWHMDRFGVIRPYLDNNTAYGPVPGMHEAE